MKAAYCSPPDNGDIEVAEEIVPVTLFIGMTIVFCLFFWFRYRMRNDMQQTIRTAIEKGQELSPEIIDRLGQPVVSRHRDLRVALVWLAIAAGTALIGLAAPDPSGQAFQGTLAAAALPLCIGVAYLIMWRFAGNES